MKHSFHTAAAVLVATLFLGSGCASMYYKSMEKFGYEKRDILVNRVADARDAQKEAKEQFADALTEFSALTDFDGGDLQQTYERLKKQLDRSEDRAGKVGDRIDSVERVSKALFREWKQEIDQFENPRYAKASRDQYHATQAHYDKLIDKMNAAESKMEPVLTAFRDQVLFLKHNLNAAAIASLKTELAEVETDIGILIKDMEASIAEADAFIQGMQ